MGCRLDFASAVFVVEEEVVDEMPVGSIALWSPLNGAVPTGWAECDGTANAPGPDLRNRFVVGRGTDHAVDTSGGSQTHTHANHVVTQPNAHTDVFNHVHVENLNSGTTGGLRGATPDTSTSTSVATGYSTGLPTAGGVGSQVHAGTAVDAHSAPNQEPKWYALIYIQRMT